MKPDAINLAKQINEFNHLNGSEVYSLASANLLGELGVRGASIEDIRYRNACEVANRQLINDYMQSLPGGSSLRRNHPNFTSPDAGIYVDRPELVRAFGGNTLWISDFVTSGTRGDKPYCIVGNNKAGRLFVAPYAVKGSIRHLVAPDPGMEAKNYDSRVVYEVEGKGRKGRSELNKVVKTVEFAAFREPEPKQLDELASLNLGYYVLRPGKADLPEEVGREFISLNPLAKLTDEQLTEFNVPYHLSRLELQFQTYPALNACYDRLAESCT